MSHFDSTVVIGKSVGGGGGGPREKVIRTASDLNRAQRQGNVTTTKNQFRTANNAASSMNGQRHAAIDRKNDTGPLKPIDKDLQATLHKMVQAIGGSEEAFAQRAFVAKKLVFPKEGETPVTEGTVLKIQRAYGMFVKGEKTGTRYDKASQDNPYREKLATKFPKLLEGDKSTASKPAATKPAATKPAAKKPAAKKP